MDINLVSSGSDKKKLIRCLNIFFVIEAFILIVLILVLFFSIVNVVFLPEPNTEITRFSNEQYTVIIMLREKHLLFGNATISISVSKTDANEQGGNVTKRYLETKIPDTGNEQYSINWIDEGAELINY